MDESANLDKVRSILVRDPTVLIMFAIALFLIPLLTVGGIVFARTRNMELLFAALLLTATFAVAGMVLGAVRGLRSEGAIKRRSA